MKPLLRGCAADDCSDITVESDFNFNNLNEDCGFTGVLTATYTISEQLSP